MCIRDRVKRLGGQVVKISPTSTQYVNPMDINLNYSDDDNPLALKVDFLLSFCAVSYTHLFDIERFLSVRLKPKAEEVYDVYEVDLTDEEAATA